MAIISVGYDGAVTEAQWADMIKKIGASEYGVVGENDWKVTPTTGDRTISIAPGKGWGHGVFDENTAPVQIQLDPVASGTRYDLIVMRRDWTGIGGASTFAKVNGTDAPRLPAGRLEGPGAIDEQPIALVAVNAGQTAVGVIRDLRVWGGNGGMVMWHDLSLSYLKSLGTNITDCGNGKKYSRVIGADGNPVWVSGVEDGYVPVFGIGPSLAGGVPTANTEAGVAKQPNFLLQAGTAVQYTDGSGFARITFPKPFPNGLLTVQLTNGDSSIDRSYGHVLTMSVAGAPWDTGRRNDFVYSVALEDSAGTRRYFSAYNTLHRVNWLAIGW